MRNYEQITRASFLKAKEIADRDIGKIGIEGTDVAKWLEFYNQEFDRQMRMAMGEPSGSKTC